MNDFTRSRRGFLKTAGLAAGAAVLSRNVGAQSGMSVNADSHAVGQESAAADYTIRIQSSPIEIAPKRILSTTTYNGQFPGPLLRFKEGQRVTIDIVNDTDTPEQLHWHGQKVADGCGRRGGRRHAVDSCAWRRRITFTPQSVGPAVLSHAQSSGRRFVRRTIQRAGWAGVHRTEGESRPSSTARFFSC